MDGRFIDEEELEGRTISKFAIGENAVLLMFSDGTFTKIGVGGGDGWYVSDTIIQFDPVLGDGEYRSLGLSEPREGEELWIGWDEFRKKKKRKMNDD